jgi:adenylosuccinate lyase
MEFTYAISPLDGRYGERLSHLSEYFSEFALMRSRCLVELMYVKELNETRLFPKLSKEETNSIDFAMKSFTVVDYSRIKEIEKTTRHDVKACEIFLREKTQIKNENLIHFGLTSEDVNNLAYSLLFKSYVEREHLVQLKKTIEKLYHLAKQWKEIPFPARTHGQKASPTTAGKEISVYINRLLRQYSKLENHKFNGKLNGAVGNYSAMLSAFPDYDWLSFSQKFTEKLGLAFNPVTTQIEDHDSWAEYFWITKQVNNIIMDIDLDFWLYISRDLFSEKTTKGEVGSSTMPHKVNPINFENSEGNMTISNALLIGISDKLSRSRMQRDLSDSTVTRNVGVALTHSYLAVSETLKGLEKVRINEQKCREELENSPELLAEPIQTILKKEGIKDPYDLLKQFTRGKKIDRESIIRLTESLDDVDNTVKGHIRSLDVLQYVGDAIRICDNILRIVEKEFEL